MSPVSLRHAGKLHHLGGEDVRALDDVARDIDPGEFISNFFLPPAGLNPAEPSR